MVCGGCGGSARGSVASGKKMFVLQDFDDFSDLSIFVKFFGLFGINVKNYEFLDLAK